MDQQHISNLVALTIEIGDLRARLASAGARAIDSTHFAADSSVEEIMEAALSSERDLAAIGASIIRRMQDRATCADVLAQPLNKYEEAHFDQARSNAEAIEAYCARMAN